jgi:peptidoglycan/xylan/chitin deacetylase (PgdA/CDA1 family)
VPARFILSFDCEGKWGIADRLTQPHQRDLSDERLCEAYRSILAVLEEFRVEATFAFVGAFSQSPESFANVRPAIEDLRRIAPDYLGSALRILDEGGGSGWHGHHLVELVGASRTTHEIALHGVTHAPWTHMDAHGAETEMAIFEILEGPIRQSRTFVYPRNLVAHMDVLERHGFAGFRTARRPRSRLASLLSEFNLFEAPERLQRSDGIVHIPAGYFLNWRSGARKLVPPAVTWTRATNLLRAASASGDIVHYWLHPENVASAPSTIEVLRMLVKEVAEAREADHCEVMTQVGYCDWVQSLP